MAAARIRATARSFSTRRLIPVEVEVHRADEAGAEATVAFARHDPELHAEGADVKAVTWHAARLEPEAGGWVGSAVQLECGDYRVLRFHMRLFQAGDYTIGNTHLDLLVRIG